MPSGEQNGAMGAIATPSGPWIPWMSANSTVPHLVWQAVNL